ncbi:MAG: undecaprenyl diphosphate synthase family protein, partial [Chloroflexi bacterium]|nr:undecaprenyl diphosphate synthase family protein [Chloroflexota bacterium]MCI0820355.1 undecaprenyl diphosphate synthase family protein [Chloroflexota bacterium]MCI0839816.1 undecaprenyl diphosphate synthase family protein [Chloroflexota bacterium]
TAGEMRISNFLLWQGAYSELFFVDDYWPDFGVTHVDDVLTAYGRRRRRFGSLPDETDAAAANGRGGSNGAGSRFQNGHNGA